MPRCAYLRGRFARRLLVWVALGTFVAGTAGIPMVVQVPQDKDRSQPFPCMNRPCGCASAEACWRGCCCFTTSQKLAWAEAHGVTPPAFVVATATGQTAGVGCSTKSVCCEDSEHDLRDLPSATSCRSVAKSSPGHDVDSGSDDYQLVFVLADASRKCQGVAQLWLLLSTAMLTEPVQFAIDLHGAGDVTTFTPRLASASFQPAVPPPRA